MNQQGASSKKPKDKKAQRSGLNIQAKADRPLDPRYRDIIKAIDQERKDRFGKDIEEVRFRSNKQLKPVSRQLLPSNSLSSIQQADPHDHHQVGIGIPNQAQNPKTIITTLIDQFEAQEKILDKNQREISDQLEKWHKRFTDLQAKHCEEMKQSNRAIIDSLKKLNGFFS